MKKTICKFMLFTTVGLILGCGTGISQTRLENGKFPAPLTIPVSGKITVLDFWASWCEPCKDAMPEIEELWRSADRSRVAFVGVSADSTRDTAIGIMNEIGGLTIPMVWDADGTVQKAYGVIKLPSIVILDEKGRVVWSAGGLEHPTAGDIPEGEMVGSLAAEIQLLLSR